MELNGRVTTERLELILAETLGTTAARGEQASIEVNASIFINVLSEVLASRKAELLYRRQCVKEMYMHSGETEWELTELMREWDAEHPAEAAAYRESCKNGQ